MELTHPLAALPRLDAWVRAQIAAPCPSVSVTDADFDPLFSPYLVITFTTSALTVGTLRARGCTFHASATRQGWPRSWETWRSFIDGPIEAVELDCDHRLILLPEPLARIGPALTGQLARAAAMPGCGGSAGRRGRSCMTPGDRREGAPYSKDPSSPKPIVYTYLVHLAL